MPLFKVEIVESISAGSVHKILVEAPDERTIQDQDWTEEFPSPDVDLRIHDHDVDVDKVILVPGPPPFRDSPLEVHLN